MNLADWLVPLVVALLTWWLTRSTTDRAIDKQFKAQAEERLYAERVKRVRLLRGLLAEIDENLAAHPVSKEGKPSPGRREVPYVREMWAQAKGEIGALPDSIIRALHNAYAEATVVNALIARTPAEGPAAEIHFMMFIDGRTDASLGFPLARTELQKWFELESMPVSPGPSRRPLFQRLSRRG